MELVSDREYARPDGVSLKFDLCHPGGGPTPIAVFLHGGGWMGGDRGMFYDEALWLAAMREKMVDRFQDLDADGNAVVTTEEFKKPYANMVRHMDKNGDGVLSREHEKKGG